MQNLAFFKTEFGLFQLQAPGNPDSYNDTIQGQWQVVTQLMTPILCRVTWLSISRQVFNLPFLFWPTLF